MAIKYYSGINISGNIVPSADSTFNLGGPAFYFANVYADNLYGDGSNITNIGAAESALTLTVTVKNKSGGSLAKGTVVHAAPSANPPSGNVIEVIAADYDTVANMPGLGVLNETLANDAEGEAVMFGAVSGIDTSSFLVGTELYVGNNGALTATKPTATDQLIQKIAVVIKSSQNNGLIKVFGAGRTNDVPNKIDRTIQFDANQRFTDNSLILMGGGDMFQIGHKASYSQIATYEGNLYIDNNANDFDIVLRSDDGNGGLATYYYIDGSEGLNRFTKNILLSDSVNLSLGNSFDLKLLHNGTDSYIDNSTGNLTIRNLADDSDVIISSDNGSGGTTQYFRADGSDGSVVLYHYGNRKFETTSTGAKVTGDLEVTGNFTVSGTTTFIDTTHLNVGDNIITLNADLSGSTAPTENAGIAIYRGSSSSVSFEWDETNDIWTLGDQGLVADNLNITKQNAAPTLNLLKDGNDPSTNELIGRLNFQTDYSGSPQDWARINVETNSSSVRTDMDFYVKSTSGNLETALRLQGGSSTPKAFFYNDVNVDGGVYANATASNTVPKYTFVGDTDTGLGYIGENSVGLIAQGSRKFYINNTDAYFQNLSGAVHISSDLNVDGSTFKVDSTNNRVAINGSISSDSRAYIFDSDSNPDTSSQGLWVRGVYSGTKSVAADHIKRGIYVDVDSSASGTTTDEHMLFGIQVDARNSGLADAVTGVYSYVESNVTTQSHSYLRGGYFAAASDISDTSGNVSEIRGIESAASIQDVGSFNNAFASYNRLEFTSTRNANNGASYGGYFEVEINNPNANSYGTIHGVRSAIDNNQGTTPSVGTSYLFYGDYQGTRAASNSWGIYVQGDKHYLEGKLGIGTTDLTTHALNVSGSGYISGGLTSNGALSVTGGNVFRTYNITHTDRRLTINQNSGEYPRIYNYDEGDQTFHSIKIGGGNDETSGIVIDGSGNVTIHGTLDVSGTIDLSDANLDIGSADIIFGIDATDTGARGLIWNFDGDGDGIPVNIGYIRAGGTVVGEVMQFNMNSDGSVTGSNTIYQFMNGGTDVFTVGREGNLSLRTTTNGAGSTINFSDHAAGSYLQQGNITYYHSDTASYGSGNAFVFSGTEASLTVLADGKLMFNEGLYTKPSSGTGAGTLVISSSGAGTFSGITSTGNIDVRKVNVGIITSYSSSSIEDTDAQLDLISSSSGTWGSAINLVEGASTTANTDVWSIARQTTGGSGDSGLYFNFGTGNKHDNTNRVKFSSSGNITGNSFIKSGGTSSQFLKADGSVDSNSYALSGHTHDDRYYTETESDARYGRKIFGDNWGDTPEAKYIKIEIPFISGSGGSKMYFFDVYGYRDFGQMDSQLHYRVYIHARSNGTTTNNFNMDVKGVNVAANEEFTFAYKTVASSPTEVYINVLEDFSGIQINSIPLNENILNSVADLTITSSTTAPTGTTTIIPAIYLSTTDSISTSQLTGTINADTADKWTTARTLTINGDASGSVSWDGSANATLTLDVTNTDQLNGFGTTSSQNFWGVIPVVGTDGVIEVGKYIDFHEQDADTDDFDYRLTSNGGTLSGSGDLTIGTNDFTAGTATIGGILLQDSVDRSGLLEVNQKGTNSWSGIQVNYGDNHWSFMGNTNYAGLYDDKNSKWAWLYGTNNNLDLYYNGTVEARTQNGYFLAINEFRSAVFRGTNTVYHVTPAGTSNLNGLTLGGTLTLGSLTNNTTSTSALVNAGGGVVQQRSLGSAAFSNTSAFASASHNHDDRYYTESEIQQFFDRGYLNSHGASNLAVGWYTIATNTGDRALGEFQIWDTASSDHQSVLFNASHHFGVDSSNDITVLANSRYSGTNFRYIRIKDGGTYDGAALQVYVDGATNEVNVAIVGGNAQSSGWVLKDWVPDATDPGDLSNYSSFGVRCQVDLDLVVNGGIITTGEIYSGGETSQFRVLNTGDEGSGNGLDADLLDGNHASAFATSGHTHDDRYLVKGGSWNGANMPGSRWGGFSVNGGEVVFQRDNPNTGQMSVMVDGNFYAGENNGFWSLYSSNSYNSKAGMYANSSGYLILDAPARVKVKNGSNSQMNINFDQIWTDSGNLHFQYSASGNIDMNYGGGYAFSRTSLRAPIFYDFDNTSYYLNPASTSNFSRLDLQAYSFFNSGLQVKRNIGTTSPSWQDANHTFSLENSDAGYISINFHRAGYTSNNIYYTGSEIITDDTFRSTIDMRAPIFYDSDNTSYYINPAGLSYVNEIRSNEAQANPRYDTAFYVLQAQHWYGDNSSQTMYIGESGNTTHLRGKLSIGGTTIDSGYALSMNGSIRMYGYDINHVSQLHFNDNVRFYDDGNDNYLNFKYGDGNNGGIKFLNGSAAQQGYLYAASSGFGLLSADGTWAVQTTNSATTIHHNARSPLFYDSDNTGYYVDPNSTSRLENLTVTHFGIANSSSTSLDGIALYGGYTGGEPTYGLLFTGTALGTHGSVTGSWATYFTMNNDNTRGWIFRRVGSGNCASISGGGTASFNGDVIAYYSDMRLKTKLGDIEDPIGKIQALNGFYYEPNEVAESYGYEKERRVGLSAQEVEAVLPEIVTDAPIGDGYKTVDYAKLVPVLVEAIKEQQKQIDELKKLINP